VESSLYAQRNSDDTAAPVHEGISGGSGAPVADQRRTQREIAGDLGIGQSTLVRWLGQNRDRRAAEPSGAQNDVTAELTRLHRENEILRQERDILKKAALVSPREGNR
jgi:transposase